MFASIRRHQQWLFAIIIGVVIISFVIFFTPDVGRKFAEGRRGGSDFGTVNGQPVSREEYLAARREAALMFRFNYREWPGRGNISRQVGYDLDRETLNRVIMVRKLKDLKVEVGDDAVIQQIRSLFRDGNQQYDPERYQLFIKHDLGEGGLNEDDFYRFLQHELGVRHLGAVFGLGGQLVSSRAAEEAYRRENEQVVTEAVFLAATNYLAKVKVDPKGLGEFYTNRMASYRLPVRVQASYVPFEAINFLTEAGKELALKTNLMAEMERKYQSDGTNNFKDAAGKVLSKEAALERMKEEKRHELALKEARKKANEFASELFEVKPAKAEQLAVLATKKGLAVKETAPFSQFDGPKELNDITSGFARTAFALTEAEPFAAPVVGTNAVYVLTVKKQIPSEIPPLESIKAKVTEDYRDYLVDQEMQKAGAQIYQSITNGMAKGKTFKATCEESKLAVVGLPAFSREERSLPEVDKHVGFPTFRSVAFDTQTGRASNFVPVGDRGFILFVKARQPVAEEKLKKNLPEYVKDMRESRQNRAFGEWFSREVQQARPTTVGVQE